MKMKKLLFISLVCFFIISCEKEIDIDLNKNSPKFVIEGNISNIKGESKVKISKTLNFDDTIPFPAVRGALVTIIDNSTEKNFTLIESSAGIYTRVDLTGIEGHDYTLLVKIGNEVFTAVSKMPFSVQNYFLVQENLAGSGFNGGSNSFIQITPHYSDLSNPERCYQFVVTKNDKLDNDIFIRSEAGNNVGSSPVPIWVSAEKNDKISVDMQCIDKAVFNYLFGLTENIYQSSATPSNPTSNISNGALGFFKAHTSQKKMLIIE